jgi:hypothetical protein
MHSAMLNPDRGQGFTTSSGTADDFICESLTERTKGPRDVFLFAVLLACLALPATTSLPLGEYRANSRQLSWFTRIRRWSFLGCKLALLLPIVYFVLLNLAHLPQRYGSDYVRVHSAHICVFNMSLWTALESARSAATVSSVPWEVEQSRSGRPTIEKLLGMEWNGADLSERSWLIARSRDGYELV